MEAYSSGGEDVVIKTRKPYTITKQRERWTDDEHSRFLQALKLYGRAWQRIEEHIGSKTAVQIRSHAQKFFSKLEKEAVSKGVPAGNALDIQIPPPRPKRKPSNPYPRKMGGACEKSCEKPGEEPIETHDNCSSITSTNAASIPESSIGHQKTSDEMNYPRHLPVVVDEKGKENQFAHTFLAFPPVLPPHEEPFLRMSSTFMSMILSILMQNPAAHAAATFAALFPSNPLSPPSMEAIAASTVAAATAWWAAHGLLPYPCTFPPPEAKEPQNSPSKASDSEAICGEKPKSKDVKFRYRSSCGSNTPSSSEVEVEVEMEKGDASGHPGGESATRRGRMSSNPCDSRKEVSEEGRLAFQALFSMEVLPQSFSRSLMKGKRSEEEILDLSAGEGNEGECDSLNLGLGNEKAKGRRMGFKPYKNVEARGVPGGGQGEESCSKRIRVQ